MPIVPTSAFPFCGPSNLSISPVIDAQRSINLYPEPGMKGSKTGMGLVGRPGLSAFMTLPASPARALWAGDNKLYAVGGGNFYQIGSGGTISTNFGAMAGSAAIGPAYIQANGTQLLVCDPSAGTIFNANNVGPAMNAEFSGVALEYLDGFYLAIATGASLAGGNPNQINSSAFGDGTNWAPSPGPLPNFVIRSGSADLTIQLATLNSLLYIFGQKTTEIWYDAGNATFPLARINGGTLNIGCMSAGSVVKFQNTILWLAADSNGYGKVYMMNGTTPQPVSTPAVEYLISLQAAANLPIAWAYGYEEAGHVFYVLNFPAEGYAGFAFYSLVYDVTSQLWHERSWNTESLWPCCFASVPGFNSDGPNFVGDGYSGKIMFQGVGYPSDLGTAINYVRTAPHISDSNQWVKYPRFELDCDIGSAQPYLSYSNDGGRNFSSWSYPMMQSPPQGNPGGAPELKRFYALQLGRSRDRVFRVSITDSANLIRIASAYVTANPGAS